MDDIEDIEDIEYRIGGEKAYAIVNLYIDGKLFEMQLSK